MLFEDAVARRLVGRSEAGRLQFVAAAEHARAVASKNACGLFARLVRDGLWHHATQAAEEAACGRLCGEAPRTSHLEAPSTSHEGGDVSRSVFRPKCPEHKGGGHWGEKQCLGNGW